MLVAYCQDCNEETSHTRIDVLLYKCSKCGLEHHGGAKIEVPPDYFDKLDLRNEE